MSTSGYLLGIDLGSSSIKASLLDIETNVPVASAVSPDTEMVTLSPKPGWAEQNPDTWWAHTVAAVTRLKRDAPVDLRAVRAIGIAYQMHGLVIVDRNLRPLRNAIIWCDSRAVDVGARALRHLGPGRCLSRLLNSPGNFTASKLKWVKDNEKGTYRRIHKMMLPGDYLALRMTGEITITPSGLSEGIFWDYRSSGLAKMVLREYGIDARLIPDQVPTFAPQGSLTREAAGRLGLDPGTPVAYRAGDQPNNAFSLNVLQPGEVATTAGTSGVVYAVLDKPLYDRESRVNTFVHVNHTVQSPRYGMLLCLNGAGILNSWLRRTMCASGAASLPYEAMNALASQAPIGCDGLAILPYGNGAERTLGNSDPGATMAGLRFTIHSPAHLLRAGQEGIVFALSHGLSIMKQAGVSIKTVRAGYANMFLSDLFSSAFATTTGATVELFNTDGAQGAARGAGLGSGIYRTTKQAFAGLKVRKVMRPVKSQRQAYRDAFGRWSTVLDSTLR